MTTRHVYIVMVYFAFFFINIWYTGTVLYHYSNWGHCASNTLFASNALNCEKIEWRKKCMKRFWTGISGEMCVSIFASDLASR